VRFSLGRKARDYNILEGLVGLALALVQSNC
jgi:hypothetical protein